MKKERKVVETCDSASQELLAVFKEILHSTFMQFSNVNNVRKFGGPNEAMHAIEYTTEAMTMPSRQTPIHRSETLALGLINKLYAETIVGPSRNRVVNIVPECLCYMVMMLAGYVRIKQSAEMNDLAAAQNWFHRLVVLHENLMLYRSSVPQVANISKAYIDTVGDQLGL